MPAEKTTATAKSLIAQLKAPQSDSEREKIRRYFKGDESGNKVIGVRMKRIFDLAKEYIDMPVDEIEKLLESPYYEARMGAVSIMDFQARSKKTSDDRRKELFDLYIERHDRINNWDFVDRAAPHVVGGYLIDKPRDILYKLARSKNVWERRTAIVSTYYFIKSGDVSDTFKIAAILLNDHHELIHKAVGSWLREAGGKDGKRLLAFLDKHTARMPRTMLRYATEKLNAETRAKYMDTKDFGTAIKKGGK
jgi:3-methyladenine DNA glycosylase AlkD